MHKDSSHKPNEDKKNSDCCKDHGHSSQHGKHSNSPDKCSTQPGKGECSDSKHQKTPFKQEKDQHKGGCCSGH